VLQRARSATGAPVLFSVGLFQRALQAGSLAASRPILRLSSP
jgi:hypothetical protein